MSQQELRALLSIYNGLYKETDEIYHALAKHFGLSDCAFWILYFVRERGEAYTQTELCDMLFLSKQTVNSALKSLERKGYLQQETSADDRRNKRLSLTPAGAGFATETIDRVFALEEKAFARFTERERETYLSLARQHVDQLRGEADKIMITSSEDL